VKERRKRIYDNIWFHLFQRASLLYDINLLFMEGLASDLKMSGSSFASIKKKKKKKKLKETKSSDIY
jgi:hypothetical protein